MSDQNDKPVQATGIIEAYDARVEEVKTCSACAEGGGCESHGVPPKGPFRREIMKKDSDGRKIFVEEVVNPEGDPFWLRPEEPKRDKSRPAFDYFFEWVCTKVINGVNWVRALYYAGKSVVAYYKYGLVTFETYRLRWVTGCGNCEYHGKDVETGREYCRFGASSCGCPSWIDLLRKLRLKSFNCPAGRFPAGNITILNIERKPSNGDGNDLERERSGKRG